MAKGELRSIVYSVIQRSHHHKNMYLEYTTKSSWLTCLYIYLWIQQREMMNNKIENELTVEDRLAGELTVEERY